MWGFGFRAYSLGLKVQDLGFRVLGLGWLNQVRNFLLMNLHTRESKKAGSMLRLCHSSSGFPTSFF